MNKPSLIISLATALLASQSHVRSQGAQRPTPTITLAVLPSPGTRLDNVTIARSGGRASLLIAASASGGFSGTVSGTVTVSEPINADKVGLAEGTRAQTYPFTLGPGEATPASCSAPVKNCFIIVTSASNNHAGEVFYTITVDPSKAYSLNEKSFAQVRVTVR